jgi:hypothetical protein
MFIILKSDEKLKSVAIGTLAGKRGLLPECFEAGLPFLGLLASFS